MDSRLIVIGLGPGHPDYILPIALKKAREVKFLIGSGRGLQSFPDFEDQSRILLKGNVENMLCSIEESWLQGDTAVLVSGDPGYYSLLDAMKAKWPEKEIEVIIGIGSLPLAFAKVGIPWHHATLASFHGRTPPKEALEYQVDKKLGLLTDPRENPSKIGEALLNIGWSQETTVWICENLTYENERIRKYKLDQLPEKVEGPAVWVVE